MRKILICLLLMFVILTGILAFALVSAETTNPWSAGSNGAEKNSFTNLEDVYIKSTKLCEPFTEVNLYITENKGLWLSGDNLIDARGTSDVITLSNFNLPLTKIWSNPSVGEYDLAVDCNQNGKYDYTAYLKENEVYDNKTTLTLGEGLIFKKTVMTTRPAIIVEIDI